MTPDREPGPASKALMLAGIASVAIGAVVEGGRRQQPREEEPERVELLEVQEP